MRQHRNWPLQIMSTAHLWSSGAPSNGPRRAEKGQIELKEFQLASCTSLCGQNIVKFCIMWVHFGTRYRDSKVSSSHSSQFEVLKSMKRKETPRRFRAHSNGHIKLLLCCWHWILNPHFPRKPFALIFFSASISRDNSNKQTRSVSEKYTWANKHKNKGSKYSVV